MRPAVSFHYDLLLEFRVHFRDLFGCTDLNRTFPDIPLYSFCIGKVQFYCPNYTRKLIWMSNSLYPYKWGFHIFCIYLPSFISRCVFYKKCPLSCVREGGSYYADINGSVFFGICAALGSNVLLSSGGYY